MKQAGPTREGSSRGLAENSGVLDETMVGGLESGSSARPEYAPGTAVSRYVILYEVGAGGMGVVYAAFDPQLNRKIALKILTPKARDRRKGADKAAARLMREAQAIARLSHPNVVSVYDVGRHGPAVFVAMEFIEGVTLTRWLEQRARSLVDIRRLFAMAGRGLIAAHDAGLVHRDFKPDNVLVSPDGRVRVLDFGLARADPSHASRLSQSSHISYVSQVPDDEDDEREDGVPRPRDFADSDVLSSPLTLDDTVVGTPRYMAPEQHAGVGVDARSDQFSFCVALYQALYGQEPFPTDRLHDLVRLKQRGTIADIPPDADVPPWLEDLVLRGLSPKPAARWPSMQALVEALEEDPEAKRRRRLGLVGGGVLLVALTAAAGHQLGSTERPCTGSRAHLEGLWGEAQQETIRRAILSTELPYAEHTWGEVERRLDEELEAWVTTHQATCEATRVLGEQSDELLDLRMGCLQEHLGEVRAVLDVLQEADATTVQQAVGAVSRMSDLARCADVVELRARLPPPEDEDARRRVEELRDLMRQAEVRTSVRRVDEAQRLAEEVLRESEWLGYEPLRVEALVVLAIVLEQGGHYAESEAKAREALWAAIRIGDEGVATRAATQLVSVVGDRLARYDEGLTWYELALALLDRQQKGGAARASLLNNVGNIWHRRGDNDKALELYLEATTLREAVTSADDPVLASERINLGNAQLVLGRYDDALASYHQAEADLRRVLGPGHPQIATAVASIGLLYNETGRYAEALEQHRRALPDFEALLGPEHLYVATTISNIALALRGQGELESAFEQFRRAQRMFEKSVGAEHPQVAWTLHSLGEIRTRQGHYEEAERLHRRALEIRRDHFDDDHEDVVSSWVALAELRRLRGELSGALRDLEDLSMKAQSGELDVLLRAEIQFQLAKARWDAGQLEARVRTDIARARELSAERGQGAEPLLQEIRAWEAEHSDDARPRRPDGSILPADAAADPPSGGGTGAG